MAGLGGPKCGHCTKAKEELNTCARCKKAKYCNKACQKKDWKFHKLSCEVTTETEEAKHVEEVGGDKDMSDVNEN
jgi:AMMECR1 domain-containing protein